MSLHTSGRGSHTPIGWEDFPDERKDKPPPYTQEPVFAGSYDEDDEDFLSSRHNLYRADCSDSTEGGFTNPAYQIPPQNPQYSPYPQNPADLHQLQQNQQSSHFLSSRHNLNRADCSDSIEGGFTNPAFENPPQNPQYSPYPQNPADLHQLQQDQQSSQYITPYQHDHRACDEPPKYIAHQNDAKATLRYGQPPPKGMQATGQHPAYDPRSGATYPPPATGHCFVVQPQRFGGQPPAIIGNPILEDPPNDYLGYSIFVTLCCCWLIGVVAISKSKECRRAIAMGNYELAKEKSASARNTAHVALALGIVALIISGVIIGVRVAYMTSK